MTKHSKPTPKETGGLFLLATLSLLLVLTGVAIVLASEASSSKTEEMATGRGLEIVHGHVEEVRGAKNHRIGFKVISDEGVSRGVFSRAPYGVNIDNYFNDINYCIYLQDHLRRITRSDGKTDYEQYTTFEGIRDFNMGGSCADFPVD